jgi:hypothetical protein
VPENLKLSDKEKLDYDLQIWKVAVDTQMHFNDLLIRMRTIIISIVLAVFGAFAVALKDADLTAPITATKAKICIIVIKIGIFFLVGHFIIDLFYYFRLLLGAVKFTEALDDKYKNLEIFGLSKSISKKTPRWLAICVVVIYYLIPIVLGVWLINIIKCNFLK